MAQALLQDLRDRVVAAIECGLSRRGAAARFAVSVSSALGWHQLAQEHGRAVARKPGGDRRSLKTEAHAELIWRCWMSKAALVRRPARSGARASRVHRRDVDRHHHDPQPRSLPEARADGLSAWAPQDHNIGRGPAHDRHGRADGARWPDQR